MWSRSSCTDCTSSPPDSTAMLSVPHVPQAAYLLSFSSAADAVRFCHSAQALLMYSVWGPDCADFCGRTGGLMGLAGGLAGWLAG
jgi:hypothetical protein